MDPISSWLLPRSTAIGWLNEEDTMSSKHLWWGPFTSTFCEHWYIVWLGAQTADLNECEVRRPSEARSAITRIKISCVLCATHDTFYLENIRNEHLLGLLRGTIRSRSTYNFLRVQSPSPEKLWFRHKRQP